MERATYARFIEARNGYATHAATVVGGRATNIGKPAKVLLGMSGCGKRATIINAAQLTATIRPGSRSWPRQWPLAVFADELVDVPPILLAQAISAPRHLLAFVR
jgi:hypothetical protein